MSYALYLHKVHSVLTWYEGAIIETAVGAHHWSNLYPFYEHNVVEGLSLFDSIHKVHCTISIEP